MVGENGICLKSEKTQWLLKVRPYRLFWDQGCPPSTFEILASKAGLTLGKVACLGSLYLYRCLYLNLLNFRLIFGTCYIDSFFFGFLFIWCSACWARQGKFLLVYTKVLFKTFLFLVADKTLQHGTETLVIRLARKLKLLNIDCEVDKHECLTKPAQLIKRIAFLERLQVKQSVLRILLRLLRKMQMRQSKRIMHHKDQKAAETIKIILSTCSLKLKLRGTRKNIVTRHYGLHLARL